MLAIYDDLVFTGDDLQLICNALEILEPDDHAVIEHLEILLARLYSHLARNEEGTNDENPYDHESSPNGCMDSCNACDWERDHHD